MRRESEAIPYLTAAGHTGEAALRPLLPVTLKHRAGSLRFDGLVDSGASVNVLPYEAGLALGAVWEEQTIPVTLTGNLSRQEARALLLTATVGSFPPVVLAFAWTRADDAPLLLGQVSFFAEFDVCFFRSRKVFEIRPRNGA